MNYKSILVNLDLDGPIAPVLNLAVEFAARSGARLIGFAGGDAQLPIAGPEGSGLAAEVWQQEKEAIHQRLGELRSEFETRVEGKVSAEWRGMLGDPTRSLAETARLADIVIIAARDGNGNFGDAYRIVDPGSLVLQTGRPVLISAAGASHLVIGRIVVAWKDTREARRGVSDAVPVLQSADDVIVVSAHVQPNDALRASVADVAAYLLQHGVKVRTEIITASDDGQALGDFIRSEHADMVVSGAYGHSRLREWAFGGVTRSLLGEVDFHRLMAS